jgi:hypothetical protein
MSDGFITCTVMLINILLGGVTGNSSEEAIEGNDRRQIQDLLSSRHCGPSAKSFTGT